MKSLEDLINVSCGEFYFEEDDMSTPKEKTNVTDSCDALSAQEMLIRMSR